MRPRFNGKRQKCVTIARPIGEIQEAVDEAEEHPSTKGVEGLEYTVEEGYYPDEYQHYVDLTDCPIERRGTAFLDCMIQLGQRGFMVNSVRLSDEGVLEKLHVVRADWFINHVPGAEL